MTTNTVLICKMCGRIHLNPTSDQISIAKGWGFFVCGMAKLNHIDECFVRKTILVTKVNKTNRHDIITGKKVELDLEIGM